MPNFYTDRLPPSDLDRKIDNRVRELRNQHPTLRTTTVSSLREANELIAAQADLRHLLKHQAARAKLEAAGIKLEESRWDGYVRIDGTEAERVQTDQIINVLVRNRVEAAVGDQARAAAAAALREVEEDRKSFASIDAVIRKYGAAQHPLASALDNAAARLRAATVAAFDLSWHPDWRIGISQALMPENAPIVLEEPPAAPAAHADSSLKTAAELAQAAG